MKKSVACLCVTAAVICAVMLSACSEQKEETKPVSNGYDVVSADEQLQEKVTDTVTAYLSALEDKSVSELLSCADNDFLLCVNETAFNDMTGELEKAELISIDFDSFQKKDDMMLVTVDYKLVYSGSFTDPEGVSRTPGEYTRKEVFSIKKSGDDYRLQSTEKTAQG